MSGRDDSRRADGRPLTVAVTGLNATDNPGPGVPVIRAIRAACPDCRIVGLAYDALDPGNYMDGIADDVWLMPYPSQGAGVLEERLRAIHATTPLDAVIPTLDSELPTYLKLVDRLRDLGIGTFLPTADMLRLRGKDRLDALRTELGVSTPRGVALTDPAAIGKLDEELDFPVMVKGQFYDAAIAYSPMDVHAHFERFRAKWGVPVIVQEFVAGEEYDVVALGDGEGGLVGSVAMRKMQLTDKGKAWGGVTVADRKLDAFVRDTMAKLRWRGPCELEVMKASDGSGLYLIEINPRFPAWVYLSVGAGRNLPWAAVQLALGEHVAPMPPAPAGVMFLRHSFDQICSLADYSALTTLGELHHAAASSPATAEEVAR
ncbi:MAG: ATP-grasp domain-containing protein [Deltaproteobacteria bacterium]|nr:ATP-grasp domain-containing protein [Deltaproteobacteria bacterium]MCB9789145.1 ATP-grasp domain-containing protein [Deltaproteobacteria bacterium]